MKNAFSMIELVFVIVIIGILAGVAIPRMMVTRDDAQITKLRSDVSTIRSAIINLRNKSLLNGNGSYASYLDDADNGAEGEELFDGNETIGYLLDYPIISQNSEGHWMKTGDTNYTAKVMSVDVKFNYTSSNGKFDCRKINSGDAEDMCKKLVN
jgi:general secretion pathway protein G